MFIHQELSLADELSVAENIYLGELPRKSFGRVDWTKLHAELGRDPETAELSASMPRTIVGDLSIANQQMVEIARALTVDAKAVIFDEPTASLTDAEKVVLFDVIRRSQQPRRRHRLHLAPYGRDLHDHRPDQRVARWVSIAASLITADTNEDEVTQLMIGRSLDLTHEIIAGDIGEVALEVQGLSCGNLFQDVSFKVRRGEVVGFYGLVGAGRTEIAETLFGLRNPSAGKILLDGEEVRIHSPVDAIAHGISLVPEDRKGQGLVLGMNCRDNMTLPQVGDLTAGPFVAEWCRDCDFRSVPRQAGYQDARLAAEGRQPVGRQPAEDRHRQVAVDAPQCA